MPRYRFTGSVLPTSTEFTMGGSITANWNDPIDPPNFLTLQATLAISKGAIEVDCESNLFGTEEYDGQVHSRALDLASAVVSTYAFRKGIGLTAILEKVTKPDGTTYNIQPKREHLADLVTALQSRDDGGIDIATILPTVLTDPTIFVALTDLIGSITQIKEAPVKCGRAIDAIRHAMAPQNDRKAGWPAMRDNLNVSQTFLEYITDASKGPRHGDVKSGTFVVAQETLRRSWVVMNRFLEFKKRGEKCLPISEFPVLTD